jgi:hypothetical protein
MSHVQNCACEDCQPEPSGPSDREKTEGFRLHRLLLAGYPLAEATKLAASDEVDWHHAVDLLTNGCPPDKAAEILL